jgi:uncharacterized hydrophobic protein (TIGR00271 family)
MSLRTTVVKIRAWLPHKRLLGAARTWLALSFGVSTEARVAVVERMLAGHARSGPTYWLQLFVAMGLATLGLVLNAAAVVIGAMLVSPLMGPIVELGMGFAVGSPLLSSRSLVRALWSVAVVIVGAALITRALPFQEITAEIAARASPTALDLLVAIFCALAAAFTTLHTSSASASTAAGTAVAIALVPPLCAVGFGLGTADRSIAQGAFLLFTANLCGILLFSVLTFWLFGFNLIDVRLLEVRRLEASESTSRSVRWAQRAFGSRYGSWLRVLLPLALVAVVWMPLSKALHEVTWEVRTRAGIRRIIQALPLAQTALRSLVSVQRGAVHVHMVVVAEPSAARALQAALTTRISQVSAAAPTVEVTAVPDLDTMESVARKLAKSESPAPMPKADLSKVTVELGDALRLSWPETVAGSIRRWRVDLTDEAHPTLEVAHVGPPLGPAAESVLAWALSERVHTPLRIRDVAIPPQPVRASVSAGAGWLPALASALEWVRGDQGLNACVTLPPPRPSAPKGKRRAREDTALEPIRAAALAELAHAPQDRVHWVPGDLWAVQVKTDPCAEPTAAPE